MNELLIKVFLKLFTLVEGRISQNICKVFCAACIAGFAFSIACIDGPYMVRAIFSGIFFLLMACFFGSITAMYEEVFGEC